MDDITLCVAPECDKKKHCKRSIFWRDLPKEGNDKHQSHANFWAKGLFDCGHWIPAED